MVEPEPVQERWVYVGRQFGTDKKLHEEWLPNADAILGGAEPAYKDTLMFSPKRTSAAYIIGGVYEVEVTRKDDDRLTRHGVPAWTREKVRSELCAQWWGLERAALAQQQQHREHADEIKRDALTEAMAPLSAIAAKCRTRAQRDAFIATVIRELNGAW